MFHLLAAGGSVANNVTLTQIPRVTDVFATNTTDGYLLPRNMIVAAAYVQVANGTRARINTPLLRLPVYPNLAYLDLATDPPNLPPVNMFWENGPRITALDPLNVEISRAGAGAAVCNALLWLCDSVPVEIQTPDVRVIQATATVTCVTSVWTQGTLTLTDTLPTGTYKIVGLNAFGTNLLAARLIMQNQNMRPGCIAQQAIGEYGWDQFRYGNFGEMGTFQNTAMPTVEFFSYGACTAQTLQIDVVKVG